MPQKIGLTHVQLVVMILVSKPLQRSDHTTVQSQKKTVSRGKDGPPPTSPQAVSPGELFLHPSQFQPKLIFPTPTDQNEKVAPLPTSDFIESPSHLNGPKDTPPPTPIPVQLQLYMRGPKKDPPHVSPQPYTETPYDFPHFPKAALTEKEPTIEHVAFNPAGSTNPTGLFMT